jgi:quinol monooxygenase YgiN
VTTKADDPTSYRVFEIYSSQDALNAHMAGDGFALVKKFMAEGGLAGELLVQPQHAVE